MLLSSQKRYYISQICSLRTCCHCDLQAVGTAKIMWFVSFMNLGWKSALWNGRIPNDRNEKTGCCRTVDMPGILKANDMDGPMIWETHLTGLVICYPFHGLRIACGPGEFSKWRISLTFFSCSTFMYRHFFRIHWMLILTFGWMETPYLSLFPSVCLWFRSRQVLVFPPMIRPYLDFLIPTLSSVIPIRAALGESLVRSLDTKRSKTVAVKVFVGADLPLLSGFFSLVF